MPTMDQHEISEGAHATFKNWLPGQAIKIRNFNINP